MNKNQFELIDGNECTLIYTYICKICGELYRYSYAYDDINLPHVCK